MTACMEFDELINRHIDNDLDDGKTATLFVHLGSCHRCRSYLRSLLALREDLHSFPHPEPSPSLDERMLEETAPARPSRPRVRSRLDGLFRKTITIPVPAAAALLLTLLATGYLFWKITLTAPLTAHPENRDVMVLFPTIDVYAQTQTTTTQPHQ